MQWGTVIWGLAGQMLVPLDRCLPQAMEWPSVVPAAPSPDVCFSSASWPEPRAIWLGLYMGHTLAPALGPLVAAVAAAAVAAAPQAAAVAARALAHGLPGSCCDRVSQIDQW